MTTEMRSKAIDWFLKQGVAVVILVGGGIYGAERFGIPLRDAHEHYLVDMAEQQMQNTNTNAEQAGTSREIVDLLKEIRNEQLRRDRE